MPGFVFIIGQTVLDMRDSGVMTTLFGQGLGSLPATNLLTQLPDKAGSYRHVSEGGNTYLALNSAGTLYMAQRVAPHPDEDTQAGSIRARTFTSGWIGGVAVRKDSVQFPEMPVVEVWMSKRMAGMATLTQTFNSGEVGAGNWADE